MTTALATIASPLAMTVDVAQDAGMLGDTYIHIDEMKGWIGGGSGVRRSAKARLIAHGQFVEQGYRDAALISLSGIAWAKDRAGGAALVDKLASLLADGSPGTLTVNDPDMGTRIATVALYGAPKLVWDSNTDVEFTIDMLAPDPRKFSPLQTATIGTAVGSGGLETPLFAGGILDFGGTMQTQRFNYITNPAAEIDVAGWTAESGATFVRDTSAPISGAASFKHSTGGDAYQTPKSGAGDYWRLSADYKTLGTVTGTPQLYLAQLGGTPPAASTLALPLTQAAPARFSVTFGPLTAGATNVIAALFAPATGGTAWFDNVLLEKGSGAPPPLGTYFDGSTPDVPQLDYAWTGAAHASISVETHSYPSATASSGMVTLVNTGTAPTSPSFKVSGYAPGFTITRVATGTTARIVYTDTVPAGSYVLISAANGSAMLDGYNDRSGMLSVSEFEEIRGGESATYLFESPGNVNASLQLQMSPAWW